MANLSSFCTCKNTQCPLHPTNHDKGCAPCIAQNLRVKKVPEHLTDMHCALTSDF